MKTVLSGHLRRLTLLITGILHTFLLMGQEGFYDRFQTENPVNGAYRVEMTRCVKYFETSEIDTYQYLLYQELSDSSVLNDRALASYYYDDTSVLITLQNRRFVYSLIQENEYDSFYFEESNLQRFFRFATINLRYLHHKGDQEDFPFSAGSDTTYEKLEDGKEVCAEIVNVRIDTGGGNFSGEITIYNFLGNDTQYVNIAFHGSRISADSFEAHFHEASRFVRERIATGHRREPESPSSGADSLLSPLKLDADLYEMLNARTISGNSISPAPVGKYRVFYFYFNGCIPCMLAKPYIRELQQNPEFEVVVLNGQDKDTTEILYRLEQDSIVGISIVVADKQLLGEFNVSAFPTVIVFDEFGNEMKRCTGFNEEWYRSLTGK